MAVGDEVFVSTWEHHLGVEVGVHMTEEKAWRSLALLIEAVGLADLNPGDANLAKLIEEYRNHVASGEWRKALDLWITRGHDTVEVRRHIIE